MSLARASWEALCCVVEDTQSRKCPDMTENLLTGMSQSIDIITMDSHFDEDQWSVGRSQLIFSYTLFRLRGYAQDIMAR